MKTSSTTNPLTLLWDSAKALLWSIWSFFFSKLSYRAKTRLTSLYALATLSDADIDAYFASYKLFDGDWSNDNGKSETDIIDYYYVLNHLCALGNVEKMYIPPLLAEGKGVIANQILYEQKMMADIGPIHADHKVLDIGCGRGRVAMHVAKATGAHLTGFNIDASQIANAKNHAREEGLADQTKFMVSSLNDPFPFEDESFDAGYNVQAFTYAKDRDALFREIFRVLKPGAKFTMLDWVLKDKYDANNPVHVDLIRKSAPLLGAVSNEHYDEFVKPMKKAGFEVTLSEDVSLGGHQAYLIKAEKATYEWLKIPFVMCFPSRFMRLFERLNENVDAFIETDELGLATTSWQIVCQKPTK